MTIGQLMEHFGWDRQMAMTVSRRVHTTPAAAGEMFSLLQPRMAVGFHFYNDPDTAPEIEREIRKAYDGPLTLARDLTVFNLRPGSIHVRQAVTPQRTWPMVPDREDFARAKRAQPRKMSDWLRAGQLPIDIYTRPEDSGAGAQ